MSVKKILKIIGIGFISIVLRSMLQLIIPSGEQTIFEQSEFVKNGTLPMVFMLYGLIAFIAITLIFTTIHKGMGGDKLSKGLKTGILYSIIWTIFLIEPLPHGSKIDLITYPLADSVVLILLGLMAGYFLSENSPDRSYQTTGSTKFNIAILTLFFTMGRLILYEFFHIYSMYEENQIITLLWVIFTGVVIGCMFDYLSTTISSVEPVTRSLVFGGLYFGTNLIFFNFFLPLVLKVSIIDLITRTSVDILFVFFASLLINYRKIRLSIKSTD